MRALRQTSIQNERAWLFAVATNLVRDEARKDMRRRKHLALLAEQERDAVVEPEETTLERAQEAAMARKAVDALAERDRLALLMREEGLDYNEIAEGATVILPVYHKGALLFMGDGHAIMADGEPTGTGVETSMDVEFSVEIKKNAHVNSPRVETADYVISLGSQPEFSSSLDRGLQMATTDMIRWLTGDYQLEPWAAHQLIGTVGKYDVVTVAGTMALRIPKKYLK